MGKLFGLIGHPVGHSMSPIMHNDTFRNESLSHHYSAFDVSSDQLEDAINGIRALGIAGFNVTIPHKIAVMEFLDEVDEEAKEIGAVNTVLNKDGKLIGYNTDGSGYFLSLQQLVSDLRRKRTLIIGAGGAARGIYISLLRKGMKLTDIANRTVNKADLLIKEASFENESIALSLKEAEKNLGDYDIIINTTSVGMSPKVDEIPLGLDNLKNGTVLSDIIYNPLETLWLKKGKEKGAIIQNGVGMFVGQGALAFEIWTGIKPDFKRMEQTVLKQLGGENYVKR